MSRRTGLRVQNSSIRSSMPRQPWRDGLASQSLVLLVITVVLRLALFGVQALIARLFGVADFNFYVTANIVGALASIASDIGLTTTVVFAARGDGVGARLIVAWLQRTRFLAAVVFWVIGTAIVLGLHHGLGLADIEIAALIVGSYVVQAYSRYRRSPLLAERRPVWEAQLEFLDRGLAIVGAVVPMLFSRSLLYVAIGQLVGTVAGYLTARFSVTVMPRTPLTWSRSAVRYGLSLSIAVLATQLYARIDYLVLSQLASANRAAAYAATYNLILGLSLVPIALTRVAISHISSGESTPRAWRNYLSIALLAGLLGGAIIAATGPLAVRTLFRLDDSQLTPVCLVLGLAFVFMAINSTIGVLAPKSGTESRFLAVVGAALFINLAACISLIPSYGMLGAGVATALTELFVTLAWWLVPRRRGETYVSQPPRASPVDL